MVLPFLLVGINCMLKWSDDILGGGNECLNG